MLVIDGRQGEGGGQILRTALSLSMVTRTPFRIERLRAGREKPGLLRQHLTCVTAATRISDARTQGALIGSQTLDFEPGNIAAGTYQFAIGSAGSTTLVFQTILPALLRASTPSRVTLSGGTHNPFAPTFHFLTRVYFPVLARMGVAVDARIARHGFYPAGGGAWHADVAPCTSLQRLRLEDAPRAQCGRIEAIVANLPRDIAERELAAARSLLSWPAECAKATTVKADGPGNVVVIEVGAPPDAEMFVAFGERQRPGEDVASSAAREALAFLAANVPVGPHLADQLLLPMALAGGGSFLTQSPTEHTRTNAGIIAMFLPVAIAMEELSHDRWRISLTQRQ